MKEAKIDAFSVILQLSPVCIAMFLHHRKKRANILLSLCLVLLFEFLLCRAPGAPGCGRLDLTSTRSSPLPFHEENGGQSCV